MATQRRLMTLGMAALALLAAACGSTAPIEQLEAAQESAEQALSDGGRSPADLGLGAQTPDDTGLAQPGSPGSSGSTGGFGPGGDPPGAPPAAARLSGPGITTRTMKIGISYSDDAQEVNDALGVGEEGNQIDFRRAYDAVVKDLNARGGIGGRRVEIVWHRTRISAAPYAQQDQEACSAWTQDNKVFATDGAFTTDTALECLEKAGTITIVLDSLRPESKRLYARYPHYFEVASIDLDTLSRIYVDSMYGRNFFGEDPRIGLLAFDCPDTQYTIRSTFIPALQRHGLELADAAYLECAESADDAGAEVAQIENAVLRFKTLDITHVMIFDAGGFITLFFTEAAQNQDYRPRYGLNSTSGNTAIAEAIGAETARSQFEDALSLGWTPVIDVPARFLPAWTRPATRTRCHALMRKAGMELPSQNEQKLAQDVCDWVWFLEATAEAAGDVVNQGTFNRALDRVRFVPTSGMGLKVSETNHDGIASYLDLKFFQGCACFRFTSDRLPVPE